MALWRDKILPFLAPRVGYLYIRLLRSTVRFTFENREVLERMRREHGHYILAFWHSRFVLMPYCYPGPKLVVMVSRNRDARMLTGILLRFGLTMAHGSSSRGGAQVLRETLRRVREGYDVGITPDGPRGPRRRVKPGVVAVARVSGLPVIPVAYSAAPARRLGSWDRTVLPYPFGRALFVYGEPCFVPHDADEAAQERARLEIEAEIDRLTDLADERVGLGAEPARPAVEV
jgi:lysophospholipid acyltransferase (LPLAT)-like uncharacterized protein